MLGKLAFQVVLVLAIHLWMFFILPAVTERWVLAVEGGRPNLQRHALWCLAEPELGSGTLELQLLHSGQVPSSGLPVLPRMFSQNAVAQLWYFVKCIYFALSAYQIRCGYPTRILGNFLTKKYNHLNLFLFQG